MTFDFDRVLDRRGSDSIKWKKYGAGVLPLWVADMDFLSPPAVMDALHARIEHGIFGYELPPPELTEAVCDRLLRLYRWKVEPDQVVFLPGIVSGLHAACRAVGEPGDGVLVQTPVYPPFLTAPAAQERVLHPVEWKPAVEDGRLRYPLDLESIEAVISPRTRLFLLCHPHNPMGRDFPAEELRALADLCLRRGLIVCSDEIHADLLLGDTVHAPLAALSEEAAAATITLMAPSKTFNIPGLGCSFAVIPDRGLRKSFLRAADGIVPWPNTLGYTAALAAYRDGAPWLEELRAYLTANRDFLLDFIDRELPPVRSTCPDSTYLAWLDCRPAELGESPYEFFLREAAVALNDGSTFGAGGEGFVRLNFGCPRATLVEALERMGAALRRHRGG